MERVEKEKEIEEFPELNDIEMEKAPNSPIAVLARESIGKLHFAKTAGCLGCLGVSYGNQQPIVASFYETNQDVKGTED